MALAKERRLRPVDIAVGPRLDPFDSAPRANDHALPRTGPLGVDSEAALAKGGAYGSELLRSFGSKVSLNLTKRRTTMSMDSQLQQAVIDELGWEPSVDAAHIGVSVHDGVVTLNGHSRVTFPADSRASDLLAFLMRS